LSSLSDNKAAYNKRIRRGRGPASGKGKTSGRGHKGQKQHGKVPYGFSGGQTADIVVHGERGADNMLAFLSLCFFFLSFFHLLRFRSGLPKMGLNR
jgi:large subunit ribosomal protein L15